MAGEQKPPSTKKLQALNETIQKRLKNLYSSKDDLPASLSISQAEQLKARVDELEAQLEARQAGSPDYQPMVTSPETVAGSPSGTPAGKIHTGPLEPVMTAALERRIGLWVTGIFVVLSLAFFAVWVNIAFFVQTGVYDISDMVLVPLTALMLVVNAIGFGLIRRGRPGRALWASYLTSVVLSSILLVLVLENMYPLAGGYLVIFSLIFITLVLPKDSRLRAGLVAAIAALAIVGIEVWHPGFRIETNNLQNIIPLLTGVAAVGIFALFIITRQLRHPRIQERLTALIMIVIIPLLVGIGGLFTSIARGRIEAGANTQLQGNSRSLATTVSTWLDLNTRSLQAITYSPEILTMNAGRQRQVLNAMAQAYPYMYLISTTDLEGMNIARNDDGALTDYSDRDWFKGAISGAPVTYQVLIGRTSGQPALVISLPIKTVSGRIVGVSMFAAELAALSDQTRVSPVGERGYTYIVDDKNQVLAHPDPEFTSGELRDLSAYPPVAALRQGQTGQITFTDEEGLRWRAYATTLENGWAVIAQQPESEILAPVGQFQTVIILLIVIGGAIMLALTWFTIRRTLQPISILTDTISAISAGDLNRVVEVNSRDEIGVLASTFNTMTGQLRGLIGSLERRVAERTHDLELASEVGRSVSERTADLYGLLKEAVELIRERFDLYYTQIYLADPAGRMLILRAGTGEAGAQLIQKGHLLPIGVNSLNGRAAVEKHTVIVADTAENPNFLPNPLLPGTRSEMSVPLLVGGRVVGVLDMQSEQPGAFTETNLPAFETLAAQLAIAIQNAALFAEAQQARSEVEEQIRRLTQGGWQAYMDAVQRGERIGFAYDQSDAVQMEKEQLLAPPAPDSLNIPIQVSGREIGTVQLVMDAGQHWTSEDTGIVQATAAQLAQHLENLRLLAQAEQYRAEAEGAVRRLTRAGWQVFEDQAEEIPGYVFDLNEVVPWPRNGHGKPMHGYRQKLIVRDEPIGELTVSLGADSVHASEIIAAVAGQLSGHLETLRLTGLNEKRAYELATVANVSTTASTVLDPDLLLQSVVDMTRERFGLYHTHIYLADDAWKTLLLSAGAGEVGRQMVADGHNIPIDAERSLVARAARERQAAIVNDVRGDPGFLANPRLPETRSEMAVPMIVGDRVLGVFDVQSDKLNGFGREDADIYTTLAAQVAVALQNARLYVEQSATVTQLRELDRLKSSFLANMSHELRTPLNSILGFADVMLEELDGPLTPNMNNDLHLIHRNGQHLLHLINDVLDMAKIEAGKMNLSPELFRIHETLEETVNITSPLAAEKSFSVSIAEDSDREVQVFADRTRIRQVMINLVNNAVKFTEQGEITISVARSDDNVLICVRDTGVGIAPDKLEAVFQEFTQVDTSTTRKAGGTGLGLPISRRLIDMHGGRMWAESTGVPGEGCTFYVELPIESRITEPIEKRER
jgi:signal transduction histidine kinase/HAMP domain-containing protein